MPTDLRTEVIQLLAGTEAITDQVSRKIRAHNSSLTFSQSGVRTGEEHEIAGLAQVLQMTQAYLLEIALKLLHRLALGNEDPRKTHD